MFELRSFACTASLFAALTIPSTTTLAADAPAEPVVVGAAPENEADVVRLPNGKLKVLYNERGKFVGSITSRDDGRTWSEPQKEFDVASETGHAIQVLVDPQGELQVYYMVIDRSQGGRKLNVDYFLDLWLATSTAGRTRWSEPRRIYHGGVGALRGSARLKSGRIVIPFSTAHPERKAGPPIGYFYTTAVYSDDHGATWRESASQLTAPCYAGYNGGNYGAVEPTMVELNDGRAWMLIRTQTGRMYESYSHDGADWSPAVATRFFGSNSPAMFRRLDDGRLLLVWNNAQTQPLHAGKGVYSGRDAIHAAVSSDEGRTWRGFREVYRDPTRHESPDLRNDRGTAYPDAVQTATGHIVLVTGQGTGRRTILRIDPAWLTATHCEDDFSGALPGGGPEGWHVYQEIGPVERFWRARRLGAQLVAHPDDSTRRVLSVGRRDAEPGAGAIWNFPAGRRGTLTLSLRVGDGFGGATVALADRLFAPCDDTIASEALSMLTIARGGKLPDGTTLTPNTKHELQLAWSVADQRCLVSHDGREVARLPLAKAAETFGPSYLCLRSTADSSDPNGILIERVAVDVEP